MNKKQYIVFGIVFLLCFFFAESLSADNFDQDHLIAKRRRRKKRKGKKNKKKCPKGTERKVVRRKGKKKTKCVLVEEEDDVVKQDEEGRIQIKDCGSGDRVSFLVFPEENIMEKRCYFVEDRDTLSEIYLYDQQFNSIRTELIPRLMKELNPKKHRNKNYLVLNKTVYPPATFRMLAELFLRAGITEYQDLIDLNIIKEEQSTAKAIKKSNRKLLKLFKRKDISLFIEENEYSNYSNPEYFETEEYFKTKILE